MYYKQIKTFLLPLFWTPCMCARFNVLYTNTDIIELSILILSNFYTSAISIRLFLFITYLLMPPFNWNLSQYFIPSHI